MKTTRKGLLTASRLAAMRACPRRHYYRYQLGLARSRQGAPLRLGAAFHAGLAHYGTSGEAEEAIAHATAGYQSCPEWADPTAWAVEGETLGQLLAGHLWRYGNDDLEFLAVEQAFQVPLVNPETGAKSRAFALAGKIDAIVRLADGREAVLEYKTAGEDIGPDSDYWLRLRCDPQISQYILAARAIGHEAAVVLYDVTRKPTIRLRQNETPEQYGQRLLTDIGDRPDYYFQRREVPCLADQLAEFGRELWQQGQRLLDCRRRGHWFRNVGRWTCSQCEFADLCLNAIRVNPDAPPAGYELLADVHPELLTAGESP